MDYPRYYLCKCENENETSVIVEEYEAYIFDPKCDAMLGPPDALALYKLSKRFSTKDRDVYIGVEIKLGAVPVQTVAILLVDKNANEALLIYDDDKRKEGDICTCREVEYKELERMCEDIK